MVDFSRLAKNCQRRSALANRNPFFDSHLRVESALVHSSRRKAPWALVLTSRMFVFQAFVENLGGLSSPPTTAECATPGNRSLLGAFRPVLHVSSCS
jgi:hypothetical protein